MDMKDECHYLISTQVLQLRGKLDMMMKKNDDKQPDNNLDIEQEALAGKILIIQPKIIHNCLFQQFTKTQAPMKVMT